MDETDPLAKQTQIREDGLDNDLAAHINKKMTELALSAAEKQVRTSAKTRLSQPSILTSSSACCNFVLPRMFPALLQARLSVPVVIR